MTQEPKSLKDRTLQVDLKKEPPARRFLLLLWRISISLKFAVLIILALTLSLIVATILESKYDTPTAQYWVYQTTWFFGVLGLLGVNIFCVAISRLPWQKKHLPFLLAHLGILTLLWGSWLTYKYGLDGQMMVTEGTQERAVELRDTLLRLIEGEKITTVRIPWTPPHREFSPISLPEFGLVVKRYITHADPKLDFIPTESATEGHAAIRVKLAGGPKAPPFMRAGQEMWLWLGDPGWMQSQAGGAQVLLRRNEDPTLPTGAAGLGLNWMPEKQKLQVTMRGTGAKETRRQVLDLAQIKGAVIETGWKFEVKVTILDFIPSARSDVSYTPSQVQYGMQATPSALFLEAEGEGGREAQVWLGLGERATLETRGKQVLLSYAPHRVNLPFGIELHRFNIDHYEGTAIPMEFSSLVSVRDEGPRGKEPIPTNHLISMNEPLKYGGYTFYQASYLPAEPRPVVSIFSVNQDPGRWVKNIGSILICLGSILLFAMKNRRRKKATPP